MAQTQKKQSDRSEARNAATGAKSSGSTGRNRPSPREENETGTDAAAEEQVAPTPIMVIAPNPKRKGSIAFAHYAKYGPTCTLTDADACKKRGVRGKDLTWDAQRRHILVGEDAENFPANGSREEQAEYLRKIDPEVFSDKTLIKWGYMDQPVETKEEAEAGA